ncbi:MAG: ATP-binding protein [Vicinamibacterales bacterium]
MGEPSRPPAADAASIAWLERVNRLALVSRLVSSTMHDMNNALQVIGGGVELLQMEQADVGAVSRAIGGKTERVMVLVHDLSRFVRDQGGAPEPVELRALAEQALTLRQFPFARLRATRTLLGDPITVHAVRRELLQVLLNLLVNAELALAGVPSPEVRVVVAASGDGAALSVEDNGPGVPPACRDGLFERRPPTQAGPADRLGIGLMVSRALAERQGGALTYTPREPTGSAFTLTLPGSGR